MKKLSLLFSAIILTGMIVCAQKTYPVSGVLNATDYPAWIDMMQDENVNFYETVNAFNKYWENRTDRKGNGYNPFKRWEWYMSHKINPDGSRRPLGLDRQLYYDFVENQRSTTLFGGDWTNIGPIQLPSSPYDFWGNGRINGIGFHPTDVDIFYIGAPAGGLWRTTDGGQNWTPLTDNQPTLGVSSIIVDHSNPDIIYLGTGDRDHGDAEGLGVYKSIDNGATFNPSNDNMGNVTVGRLIQHPTDANILYAASSSGIFKTTDAAVTWNQTISGNFKEIVFKQNDPNIIYASKSGKFYKSIDAGDNWTMITNGTPTGAYRGVIAVSAANPNFVYFFATEYSAYYGTYLSIDNGESFMLQSSSPNVMGWSCNGGSGGQAWYDLDLAVDPTDENIIYAGGVNCWRSNDAGQTWTMASNQTGNCGADAVHADLHVLEWNPLNNKLYVGNDGGIWWTDDGNIWNRITNGLAIGQQYKLGQSRLQQNHVTTGYQDNGISLYNLDTWIQSDMYADGMECEMDNHDTSLSYGCMQYGRMYRMVNDKASEVIAGDGVNGINESGDWVTPFSQHESNHEVMFIGYQNLWRTTNLLQYAPSWSRISMNNGSGAITVVECSPADEDLFYYATSGASLIRSDNIMETSPSYLELHNNLPGSGAITDIEAHPWDANIVYVTRNRNVYKSMDRGLTWENITENLPDVNMNDIAFYNRNHVEGLYVASNIGVFFKDEFMSEWVMFSDNLPSAILATEVEIYLAPADHSEDRVRISSFGRGLWGSSTYYYEPLANFEASETIIPAGCAIDFYDQSQGYPHSWSWTFEGGTPSTSDYANPVGIIYENEGTFAVTLTVTNPDGSDTKTVTEYITVVEGMLPMVNFSTEDTAQCSNVPIHFFDESEGCPTNWLWSFDPDNVTFLEGTTEDSQNPIVSLSETGLYSVTLAVSNSSGQSELIKDDYLFIGGQLLPFSEDFTGSSFDAMGWQVENPDGGITWGLVDVETGSGVKQVSWMNIFDYSKMGARNYLVSPSLNFAGYENVFMTFNYAYAERYSPSDSLIISVTDDCGENWTRIYANGPNGEGVFATSEPTTEFFEPQSASDWCGVGYGPDCPIIDLSSWAGNANIKVRFEAYSRYGNNLYVNDVEISNIVGLFDQPSNITETFILHPNPATGYVNVLVKNPTYNQVQILDTRGSIIYERDIIQEKLEIDIKSFQSILQC